MKDKDPDKNQDMDPGVYVGARSMDIVEGVWLKRILEKRSQFKFGHTYLGYPRPPYIFAGGLGGAW